MRIRDPFYIRPLDNVNKRPFLITSDGRILMSLSQLLSDINCLFCEGLNTLVVFASTRLTVYGHTTGTHVMDG